MTPVRARSPRSRPPPEAGPTATVAPVGAMRLDAIQNSLHANAAALHALLAPEWQKFLAVPAPVTPASAADPAALAATYERYSRVNTSPEFKQLAEQKSGLDLDGFFTAWLFTGSKPARTAANGLL